MSDINNIFKEALEGHEAPYDAAMWDKVSSQLSPMEDAFRNSLENHEAPYDPTAWSAIKGQIGSSSIMQWIAGSAAAIGLIAGAIAFIPSDNEKEIEGVSRTKVESNTPIVFTENKPSIITNDLSERIEDNSNTADQNNAASAVDNSSETTLVDQNTNTGESILENTSENGTDHNTEVDPDSNSELTNVVNETESVDNNDPADVTAVKYNANFSCSAYETCAGEMIIFNPKVIKSGIIYSWNFGDGMSSNDRATNHEYKEAANYDVTLTLKDEKTNTILASSTESIVVNDMPNAKFTTRSDYDAIPTVDFLSNVEDNDNKIWKINGEVVSDRNQFEHTFKEKGKYKVELLARNANGCENTSEEIVTIDKDYNLLAPNVFSPNGDGNNDDFIPVALTIGDKEFNMTIYNQAGNPIYQTNNANAPWDGRNVTDNTMVPGGVYVWGVELKNGNGTYDYYKGHITVIK